MHIRTFVNVSETVQTVRCRSSRLHDDLITRRLMCVRSYVYVCTSRFCPILMATYMMTIKVTYVRVPAGKKKKQNSRSPGSGYVGWYPSVARCAKMRAKFDFRVMRLSLIHI